MRGREDKGKGFGATLASARLARGLTQRHLGELLGGTTQSAISAWESGEAVPLPEVVFAVEGALGVAPGQLSRALGYLPADTGQSLDASVPAAIAADPCWARRRSAACWLCMASSPARPTESPSPAADSRRAG